MLLASFTLLCVSVAPAGTRADGVRIESEIDGRIFKWRVINVDAEPIMRFEAPVYKVYNHKLPDGWEFDRQSNTAFIAWATGPTSAIRKGRTAQFSARASSSGAVVRAGTVEVGFQRGGSLEIHDVIIPQPERLSTLLIPPLVITAIVVLLVLRLQRRGSSVPTD